MHRRKVAMMCVRWLSSVTLLLLAVGCADGPSLDTLGPALTARVSTLGEAGDGLHVEVLLDAAASLELGFGLCPDLRLSARANGVPMRFVGTRDSDPCGTWEFHVSAADLDRAEDVNIQVVDSTGARREIRLRSPFVLPELHLGQGLQAGMTVPYTATPSTRFLAGALLFASRGSEQVQLYLSDTDPAGGMLFLPPELGAGTWSLQTHEVNLDPRPFRVEVVTCEFTSCEAAWASCGSSEPCLAPELVGLGPSDLGDIEVVP